MTKRRYICDDCLLKSIEDDVPVSFSPANVTEKRKRCYVCEKLFSKVWKLYD